MDPDQVRLWKEQYGQVYSVSVKNEDFAFRQLTFREFDSLRNGGVDSSADAEERVVALALLHPMPLPDRTPAGVVTALAEQIFEVSGFASPKRMKAVLDQKREKAAGDVRILMKAFVLATMPVYSEESLDELTFDGLAAKVALAELVLTVQQQAMGMEQNTVTLQIVDPDEEEAEQELAKQRHAMTKKPGTAGMGDPVAQRLHSALG